MAAVELADRDQVDHRDQQTRPAGERRRVQEDVPLPVGEPGPRDQALEQRVEERVSLLREPADQRPRPASARGRTRSPGSRPPAPRAGRRRRCRSASCGRGSRSRIPITAPIVPRPNPGRQRDEERQRRVDAVQARHDVVPGLVRHQDQHQRHRVRQPVRDGRDPARRPRAGRAAASRRPPSWSGTWPGRGPRASSRRARGRGAVWPPVVASSVRGLRRGRAAAPRAARKARPARHRLVGQRRRDLLEQRARLVRDRGRRLDDDADVGVAAHRRRRAGTPCRAAGTASPPGVPGGTRIRTRPSSTGTSISAPSVASTRESGTSTISTSPSRVASRL